MAVAGLVECDGVARFVLETSPRLARRHKVEIIVGELSEGLLFRLPKECRVRILFETPSSLPSGFLSELRHYWRWVRAEAPEDYDILIAHDFPALCLTSRFHPSVGYLHFHRYYFFPEWLPPLSPRGRFLAAVKDPFLRLILRKCVMSPDVVVTNSKFTGEFYEGRYGRGYAVIYPGVEADRFNFKEYGDFVLTVARMDPVKRLELVLEVAKLLPNLEFVIAGGYGYPSYREFIAKRASKLPNVRLTGPIPEDELVELYARCLCLLHTAREENFGLTVLEAMASRKPVVSVDEGGPREIILDGKTGFLVKPDPRRLASKIELLHRDRSLLEEMGDACRRRAEEFSWERTASEMEALCARLLELYEGP